MIGAAINHFCVVGLAFALALGWLATLIVNGVMARVLESILNRRATDPYWGALLLTVLSLTLISLATFLGNRVFRRSRWPLSSGALTLSTLCYIGLVSVFVLPEVAHIINPMIS